MRGLVALLFFLALAVSTRAEDWTTADGKTYRSVTVVSQEPDGVRITYAGGVGKIPYYELSDDLLRRFGQDPASLELKREAAQKAAADAALKAQRDAAEQKKEQDEAAAAAAAMNPPEPNFLVPRTPPAAASHPVQPAAVKPNPNTAESPSAAPSAAAPYNHPSAIPTGENPYPHSKYRYDEVEDNCYLDSYPVDLLPVALDASPTAPSPPGPGATLFFSIETEGHRAEAPDTVSALFVSNLPLKKLAEDHKVKFLVDGAFIEGTPTPTGSEATPDPSLLATQVVFSLTPEQVKSIVDGKNLNLSVGSYDYRIDDAGIATFRGYQDDVDHLPPPSTNFVRSYHRFLNRLPSVVAMISTTCEYIILGAFAVVLLGTIAAFVMGLTRFINM